MTNLEMLVKNYQAKTTQPVDRSQRKTRWLHELGVLMGSIQDALLAAGLPAAQIRSVDYSLNEETLGQYEAAGLTVRIGNSELVFVPKGSMIIGGYGRVDVTGPHGQVKLIADVVETDAADVDRRSGDREWQWWVYPERGRRGGFILDGDGLAKVLELVLGAA